MLQTDWLFAYSERYCRWNWQRHSAFGGLGPQASCSKTMLLSSPTVPHHHPTDFFWVRLYDPIPLIMIACQLKPELADHPRMCVVSYARLTFFAPVTLTLTRWPWYTIVTLSCVSIHYPAQFSAITTLPIRFAILALYKFVLDIIGLDIRLRHSEDAAEYQKWSF